MSDDIRKTEYVLCCVYNHEHFIFVRKAKPAWQAGKLNFPGGKIEAHESIREAATREFEEETGIRVDTSAWERYATSTHEGNIVVHWLVHEIPATTDIRRDGFWVGRGRMTDEPVRVLDLDTVRTLMPSGFVAGVIQFLANIRPGVDLRDVMEWDWTPGDLPNPTPNALFTYFKESGKYYSEGRGVFPKMKETGQARRDVLLAANNGRMPGLSGGGWDYFIIVKPDDDTDLVDILISPYHP